MRSEDWSQDSQQCLCLWGNHRHNADGQWLYQKYFSLWYRYYWYSRNNAVLVVWILCPHPQRFMYSMTGSQLVGILGGELGPVVTNFTNRFTHCWACSWTGYLEIGLTRRKQVTRGVISWGSAPPLCFLTTIRWTAFFPRAFLTCFLSHHRPKSSRVSWK